MNWSDYVQHLLTSIPGARLASGNSVILCRCRECPDSRNKSSAHFYISIPWDNKEPSFYYCHKCNCRGYVDHNKLIAWGIYDKKIALELTEYNKSVMGKARNKKYLGDYTYQISNYYVTKDSKSAEKLRYIQDRLGIPLNYSDCNDLKICLNINDLLRQNNIEVITRNQSVINDLDNHFIGFLSIDNAFMNMRRLCGEGVVYKEIDYRYINYRIFDKLNTTQRFYTIPTTVNLATTERVKLHIAEGPFDILSVYLNCRNREEGIYTSITGNNYVNIILFFLSTFMLPYLEIHLYPDNDKFGDINRINKIISVLPDKTIPIYIHKNTFPGKKDFGVPANQIIESVMKIQ